MNRRRWVLLATLILACGGIGTSAALRSSQAAHTSGPEPAGDRYGHDGIDATAHDRAVAGGFARQDLAALIAAYAASGTSPRGTLAEATAFLRLHPEECSVLEAMFARDQSARGRSIIVDVLASTGSREAQLSMTRILETPAARHDPAVYRELLERFALVPAPTEESLGYVRSVERTAELNGDAPTSRSALVTRGAILGRRMTTDPEADGEARALLGRVERDLSEEPVEDRVALVEAIGNLAHPSASAALAPRAKEADARVRTAVARALRHEHDRGAAAVLLEMMKDGDANVARAAIESHLGRTLSAPELESFAALVKQNGTNAGADGALVGSIVNHATTCPAAVRSVLEALVARAPVGTDAANRARAAIERLPET
ncbi:MAG: HEAT repeat domain-containing protein [Labilithrix sp.]|nr:HEAT repeat domain-containing protein [Labilithrix sp.]